MSIAEIEAKYEGQMYGPFKKDLAEQVASFIEPLQQRYHEVRQSGELYDVLKQGAERASEAAEKTLDEVKRRMGFVMPR